MKITEITSCHIGPAISPEQFIPEHFFLYLQKGTAEGYDGHKKQHLKAGECCMIKKNRLARYRKQPENNRFEKIVIIFDEPFLRSFYDKHHPKTAGIKSDDAFVALPRHEWIDSFIRSLSPYYANNGTIEEPFSSLKREELLLILLKLKPGLSGSLFDFGIPQKIDLEAYMNRNYRFNVSMERFAYLTGRSLSAFKRDFRITFGETPGRWLLRKRLQEAYFRIREKKEKPSSIYLDLGFEDLSHFSYAFKKQFGQAPTAPAIG